MNIAHPEDLWKLCIIHGVDCIYSCSGLLFGDRDVALNKGYFVMKMRSCSFSEQFVSVLF